MKLHTYILVLCVFCVNLVTARAQEADAILPRSFQEKLEGIPDKQKFVGAGVVGFVATRMIIGSAMGVIKVAGAAFIAAEVLHYTGATDDIPKLSEEQSDLLQKVKNKALVHAESFRVQARRRLSPVNVQAFVDKERAASLGLAAGAFVGALL